MRSNRPALFACAALFVFGILLYCVNTAIADPRLWKPDGVPVRQGHFIEWQKAGYRTDDGSSCIVWSDTRLGNRDIYAQRIMPDGSQAWRATGQPIVSAPNRQEDPDVVAVDGGWVVAWIDYRTDSTGDIYAQKVDYDGTLLWDSSGVVVDTLFLSPVNELSVRAVDDGQGGAIVAWEDRRLDGGDIYAQRMDATGHRAWQSVLAVTDTLGDQIGITADGDGAGNMLVAWQDSRSTDNNQNIYAAKITRDGQLPWGVNGVLVCNAIGAQESAKLCPDGSGGCFLAWVDPRNSSGNLDVYMQRLNASGVAQWAADGIPLCNAPFDQTGVRVAVSLNGSSQDACIAVWEDTRVNGTINEVFGQKISPNGTMQWAANGVRICGDAGQGGTGDARDGVRLTSDLAGGLVCAWEDTRGTNNPLEYDLYAGRVLSNGSPGWTGECGVLVGDGPSTQFAPLLRADDGDGIFIVYDDTRTGSQLLRYQNLSITTGTPTLDPVQAEIVFGLDGDAVEPEMIEMNPGKAGVVWKDNRFGIRGPALFYQVVEIGSDSLPHFHKDLNGDTLVPDNEGFSNFNQGGQRLCTDENGGFYVSFVDQRGSFQRIRLTRVNSAGDIACSRAGEVVYTDAEQTDQLEAYCASDGEGGCYVVWVSYDPDYFLDVYAMRMNSDCQRVWSSVVRLTDTDEDDGKVVAVKGSDGCCIVTWQAAHQDGPNIMTARVCRDGTVSWNFAVCDAINIQDNPAIAADDAGGAYYAWSDYRTPISGADIYAQHVDVSGAESWQHNGVALNTDTLAQDKPVVGVDALNNAYVAWEDYRNTSLDIFAQKINPSGVPYWTASGRPLCISAGDQKDICIQVDRANGFYAAWMDYRGFYQDIFGTHITENGQEATSYWVPSSGGVICDLYQAQISPTIADDGHGGVLCAWEDLRASGKEQLRNIWANWINDLTVGRVIEIPSAAIPELAELGQNYPNPFNPMTSISFSIPHTGNVEIKVFNTLGQQVAKLVDRTLTAGRYEVQFDASQMASGVYFYRMKTGGFTDVKKMTLLR